MPAYLRARVSDFLVLPELSVLGALQAQYARDGFASQYTEQAKAWGVQIPLLQKALADLVMKRVDAVSWTVLLEYPLYRLRKRIDAVILSRSAIAVIEGKAGEKHFKREDERQVEEYALDLRDFHEGSQGVPLYPILWCTGTSHGSATYISQSTQVAPVQCAGRSDLADVLSRLPDHPAESFIVAESWDGAAYRPVPNVIEAATSIFAGHDVRSIAQADASNLAEAGEQIIKLIVEARQSGYSALIFLTGVPGSGKTLAGLQVVHDAVATGAEAKGDIVYLSGNTPLVTVLREALARDEHRRTRGASHAPSLETIRRVVRARIQHISDFLKQYLAVGITSPPHEHVIVFDEAQRAWDEVQGEKKFGRTASAPALLLDIMARHEDWCACVCLVGGGQEINSGEQGVAGWGKALRQLTHAQASCWKVFGPEDVFSGGPSTGGLSLGTLPERIKCSYVEELQLVVPLRTFRTPAVSTWVARVLDGDAAGARETAPAITHYPILLTRSLEIARDWLKKESRGYRRYGLLASSGARRLRAEGLGVLLSATDGAAIAHWYLNPMGDIRSSFALEVPANEYTSQGLEIDFATVCWGGDMLYDSTVDRWRYRSLGGTHWKEVNREERQRFIKNSYRVLLTRAREGMIIWVPQGSPDDATRSPEALDATAAFLQECGTVSLDSA